MGRTQKHRVNRDKNAKTLPQTPKELKRPEGEDETLELAKELDLEDQKPPKDHK